MYAFLPRLVYTALGVLFCSVGSLAVAQTTIQMNTAQGNCTAVTDSSGLTLVPNSTMLQANGVTLTAQQSGACTPTGGGSASNFSANVQISGGTTPGTPYTPAVNAPFYVIWSTTADANVCTRGGGALSGLSGWVPGSQACSGNCAGSHTEQVTPTTGGNYAFSVTCTNASGFATSSAVIVPPAGAGAPTPSTFTVTAPGTATAGNSFTATWPSITNAATCVGTATLGGAAISSLGEWTTSTATTPQSRSVSVPATATGNLVLILTCWNSDHSASAIGTSGVIAVSPASAGTCPSQITSMPGGTRNLLITSSIRYGTQGGTRSGVSLAEWDNIWGHGTATDPVTPWPGLQLAQVNINQFSNNSYIGAHFKTGSASQVANWTGHFVNGGSSAGTPNTTMSISTVCGDFSEHLPSPGCFIDHAPGDPPGGGVVRGNNLISWNFTSVNPAGTCNLSPNTDYYVNIIQANPSSSQGCSGSNCPQQPISIWHP
jgi:hypothetical protein